jgi:superoxide reductase
MKGENMAKKHEVYKCDVCGNIVEVLHGGEGDLVCCGENMKLFKEKTTDEGKEKHVPVIKSVENGIKVKVGSNPHPMEDKHYIEWIEIIDGDQTCRHYLNPGETPEAVFKTQNPGVTAREYCNVHGLWKS